MKHPEVLLLPALMLADYYLTVTGAILKDGRYAEHFRSPEYELNPLWQKQIRAKQWFSPRHLLLTLLYAVVVSCLAEIGQLPDYLIQGLFGCLFVVYGAIIGKHLANILTFRYVNNNPEQLTGQITMAHALSLSLSMYQYIGVAIPVGILAVFSRSAYVVGGFVGTLVLFRLHFAWLVRHKKQLAAAAKAKSGGATPTSEATGEPSEPPPEL